VAARLWGLGMMFESVSYYGNSNGGGGGGHASKYVVLVVCAIDFIGFVVYIVVHLFLIQLCCHYLHLIFL